jgi:hypothetical protein
VFVTPRIYLGICFGICPAICPKICHAWEKNKKIHGLLEFSSNPSLGGGPNANSGRPCTLIHSLSCRTPCRLFTHELFFWAFRPSPPSELLVWSELGQSPPFRPMRDLTLPWSRAFSLVCEVALTTIVLFYFYHMWGPACIEIHRISVRLRA